jgi:hypothetical protein
MLILNPATLLSDPVTGAALVDIDSFRGPSVAVAGNYTNPDPIVEDEDDE